MEVTDILSADKITALGLMGLIVFAFLKQWIVPGWLYKQERENAKKWEQRCLEAHEITGKAVGLAKESQEMTKESHP